MTAELDEQPTGLADDVCVSVVRSSHDAIVAANSAFEIIAWNAAAERLYGYPARDVLGRSLDLIIPPEQRRDQREMLSLFLAGAAIDHFRTWRVHRDGHTIPVSVSMAPLADRAGRIIGLVSTTRRLSDRERLEVGFKALLEAAPDAVIGVADSGQVVLSNAQADRLFGVARNGLIGRSADALLSPALSDDGEPAGHTGDGAVGAQPRTVAHRSDGTPVPVEITAAVIDTDQGRMRCAVIRDVTERLRAQNEYLRMRAEADHARMEAQLQRTQRLESLGQLAGGVAHDFNNIIGVIVNYAGFIAEEAGAAGLADLASDAEQINRAGQRGAELTHQLLAFARREVVRPRALSLNTVVTDVEQMLRRAIGEHITLTTRLTNAATTVTADPGQLEQVLVNLAVNARDAMPRGGHLSIVTDVVDTDDLDACDATDRPTLLSGRCVRLRVSDTGTGMPQEVIDRAFEPFFTTKPAGQGTGLGLATVYGIITAAGGDLSISSEAGTGTTMTVLLPVTDDSPADTTDTTARAPVSSRGETVLAVEDEPALRQVIRRVLTSAGYQILMADDGPAALALAERHVGPIDLLLTDVVMPHMLGKELAERLHKARPETAVLYMSGYAQPVLASQGTLDPDVTLLEKPFTKPQLLTAVRQILDHRSATAP
ncbi:PAS domain S-box protein [Krasilnikovia sp. MM14-A1004]|uniref:PAS domain S-box protein n=1 Tax=Krasilnikovia sp. MM14-A1004 TaxID=3373541 RepID=UPI00399C763D